MSNEIIFNGGGLQVEYPTTNEQGAECHAYRFTVDGQSVELDGFAFDMFLETLQRQRLRRRLEALLGEDIWNTRVEISR